MMLRKALEELRLQAIVQLTNMWLATHKEAYLGTLPHPPPDILLPTAWMDTVPGD